MSEEEFRPWPSDPRYLVGDQGTVIGLQGRPRLRGYDAKGYPQVSLSRSSPRSIIRLHVMVCETFHGPRPPGLAAAHENGVKDDCRAVNLSWKTYTDNNLDKRRHGRVHPGRPGEKNNASRLTAEQVREIRASKLSGPALARKYGVSKSAVNHARAGRTWAHLEDAA